MWFSKVRESNKNQINSGLGIIVICPDELTFINWNDYQINMVSFTGSKSISMWYFLYKKWDSL